MAVTANGSTKGGAPAVLTALLVALGSVMSGAAVAEGSAQNAPIAVSPAESAPALNIVVNRSTILSLEVPATRVSVANPAVADITPINSREIYVLGKSVGNTNLIVWNKDGGVIMMDIKVMPEPVPVAPAPPAPADKDKVEVIKGLNKSFTEF